MNRNAGFENKYEVMFELWFQRQNVKKKKNWRQRYFVEKEVIPALERILRHFENGVIEERY